MDTNISVIVSAPGKVHLLGEWAVVWGKPALLTSVDLKMKVILRAKPEGSRSLSADESETSSEILRSAQNDIKKIIEPIVKKELKIKTIPAYSLEITSQIPLGAHLGSSAAISVSTIAALLTFLKAKWDLGLINKLAYQAEKVFHGNPSGADNSTICYGGLIWFRKESEDLKIIHPLPFSIPASLAKNFILLNTGKPEMITKQMIEKITAIFERKPNLKKQFLEDQENLVIELLAAIKESEEKELIRIIKEGEANLESIGVCSAEVKKIIRDIEKSGGAAKICGAGASNGPTGVLLCYHPNPAVVQKIAEDYNLEYFKAKLGVEGVKLLKKPFKINLRFSLVKKGY